MKERRSIGSTLFSVLKYVSLIAASLVALIPVVVCVFTAFKTNEEYDSTSVLTLPQNFSILRISRLPLPRRIWPGVS